MIVLAGALLFAAPLSLTGCGVDVTPPRYSLSISSTLRESLAREPGADFGDVAAFYAARNYRPIWISGTVLRPESRQFVELAARSGEDGLDPHRYEAAGLASLLDDAAGGDPSTLAHAEIMLSRALVRYVQDLHQPVEHAGMIFTDPSVAPPFQSAGTVLAAAAPSLREYLADVRRMNPLYRELREALAAYRSRWSALPRLVVPAGPVLEKGSRGARVVLLRKRMGLAEDTGPALFDDALENEVRAFQEAHGLTVTGKADALTIRALNAGAPAYERLILANLDRARALPVDPGRRYILVDAASAQLWLYEDGRLRDTMRVIVGKPAEQTPAMAGMIRFAIVNPYWNIPPDLAQRRAAHVLKEGPAYLARERLELLSDWSDRPRILDPSEVDWKAVAAGDQMLRVRQLPGPHNMMGAIKFMMPNDLGIYLHDTPYKELFAETVRSLSAGCVRVEDAGRLARWLYRGDPPSPGDLPEHSVDLPAPVPVYITYLTARPKSGAILFQKDVYGRDPAVLASIDRRNHAPVVTVKTLHVPSGPRAGLNHPPRNRS